MEKKKCRQCGKEWLPRVEKPEQCPRCKRYDWELKKEVEDAF